jgi:hypothetical protein
MCLYVDLDDRRDLDNGERRARTEHRCDECKRRIEPGESYRYWTILDEDGVRTEKMCAHCWGTIELGASFTGCPKNWYWGSVHELDEEMGFVGNILKDFGHHLSFAQEFQVLRTVAGRKRQWRRADGSLLPVPALAEVSQ